MKEKLETIIKYIIGTEKGDKTLSKINIPEQFQPGAEDNNAAAKNLNAGFLIILSGKSHPLYNQALQYLDSLKAHPSWEKAVCFYQDGFELIRSEIADKCSVDDIFKKDLVSLHSWIVKPENRKNRKKTLEKIRRVFFPEGVSLCDIRNEEIAALRKKRKVSISRLNTAPITNPAGEILFTSNILLTLPPATKNIDELDISTYLKQRLKQIARNEQVYWYDHPVPVGTAPEHNEILYGLKGLDEAIEFEKQRGAVGKNEMLTCVLSVSSTHKGLQELIKEYLEEEFKKEKTIQHLNVYVFTETDTINLIEEILIPAAEKYLNIKEHSLLYEIIGVDGEYGRHYTFLKAISAFWQVFIDSGIKGTFKIDLDQVFPQKELVEQSGFSAFEHLKTPLWGAEGTDNKGNKVKLGMIAGALVNKKDIKLSLFTPDVCFPSDEAAGDELIFFSPLPQNISTRAEMMTRYTDSLLNGKTQCIQRIHVTGGTSGILVDSLRKFRPFTPTFIGRAEDQAYILSVLCDSHGNYLRYVHKDGLIMRHDKEAFAREAIKTTATGKLIGDYLRILLFSYYTRALPWSFNEIKDTIDPFTGCFVSKIPVTVVYLRFALKTASFFAEKNQQGIEFMQSGASRIHETVQKLTGKPNPLIEQFQKEKQGWGLFYDILDAVEEKLKKGDDFAIALQKKARNIIGNCKIHFKG